MPSFPATHLRRAEDLAAILERARNGQVQKGSHDFAVLNRMVENLRAHDPHAVKYAQWAL